MRLGSTEDINFREFPERLHLPLICREERTSDMLVIPTSASWLWTLHNQLSYDPATVPSLLQWNIHLHHTTKETPSLSCFCRYYDTTMRNVIKCVGLHCLSLICRGFVTLFIENSEMKSLFFFFRKSKLIRPVKIFSQRKRKRRERERQRQKDRQTHAQRHREWEHIF